MASKFPKSMIDQYELTDALPRLNKILNESVDLVFTSIPDISQMTRSVDIHEYEMWMKEVSLQFKRIVKPKGFIVLSQQDRRVGGNIFPKHIMFYDMIVGQSTRWKLKDEKIVVKDEIGKTNLFQFTYQYLSVFTREGKYREEGRRGYFLKDIIIDTQKLIAGQKVWSIEFCRKVIKATTDPGMVVIDPFAGAGPVLYAASKTCRYYWGAEILKQRYNKDFKLFRV